MALEISVRNFRLVEGEADHGVFVVYDKDCIGRGVQFLDSKSSREIGLCLLLPATEGDVG